MKKTFSTLLLAAVMGLPLFTTACAHHRHETVGAYTDDRTLSATIKSDLLRDPIVRASDVNVSTYRGEVQLSGFVNSQDQKDRAGRIAASTPGVTAVHNDLLVRTGRY